MLEARVNDKWSVKEHLGHLADLAPLDDRRLSELLHHAEVLSAADIENRATKLANHRRVPVMEIIRRLTAGREDMLPRLELLTEEQIAIVATILVYRSPCALWTGPILSPSMTIII